MAEDVTTTTYASPAPAVPRVSGATADDWAVQATDAIVRVVGTAHDKITGPALKAARYVIYGLLAAVLGGGLAIVGTIIWFRLWNNYLPDALFGERHMWVVYLGHGIVLMLAGMFAWTRRKPRPAD